MGILYIVATPIGNMEDITLRAIRVLCEVDYICCEDTRKTGNLLNQDLRAIPGIERKKFRELALAKRECVSPVLLSYYEENESNRIPQIINLLKSGKNVALVSNAGTPTVSDPGFKLVRECVKGKIPVVSIPGPSAILTALTSSGLPTDKFLFLGFLPQKPGKRQKFLHDLALLLRALKVTVVLFEAPHRLIKTLEDLKYVFGDIEIVVCRELTKIHEEIWQGKVSQAINYFKKPVGEFVLLFNIPLK